MVRLIHTVLLWASHLQELLLVLIARNYRFRISLAWPVVCLFYWCYICFYEKLFRNTNRADMFLVMHFQDWVSLYARLNTHLRHGVTWKRRTIWWKAYEIQFHFAKYNLFVYFCRVCNGSVNCTFKRLHRKQTHVIVVRGYWILFMLTLLYVC